MGIFNSFANLANSVSDLDHHIPCPAIIIGLFDFEIISKSEIAWAGG